MLRRTAPLAICLLASCATVPSPQLQPFADSEHWVLTKPLRYRILDSRETVVVPQGFITDFASVPRALWVALPRTGRYTGAAIVHDYLYWTGACSREQADRIFAIAMRESRVGWLTRNAMYQAVSKAGESAWVANERERSAGGVRVIAAIPPDSTLATRTWPEYKASVKRASTGDTSRAVSSAACALGNAAR